MTDFSFLKITIKQVMINLFFSVANIGLLKYCTPYYYLRITLILVKPVYVSKCLKIVDRYMAYKKMFKITW